MEISISLVHQLIIFFPQDREVLALVRRLKATAYNDCVIEECNIYPCQVHIKEREMV